MRATLFTTLAVCVLALPAAAGGEWPQFRGPDGSATSPDKDLPARWNAATNIAWKVKLPGYSWSSPILWGDKVLVTTAVTDKQQKPTGGFGGFAGPGGPGGRPGGFGPPKPGTILPPFVQDRLNVTDEQKKSLEDLQKAVTEKLDKVLTAEQKKKLEEPPDFGAGGFRSFPLPGEVLSASARDSLKLSADQKKQLDELQKDVDGRLAKILTDEQKKQIQQFREMRDRFGRGPGRGGFGPPGGFPSPRPPDDVFRFEVLCLDRASGKTLWKQTALERKPAIASFSKVYASETPVTDGERVCACFGMHGLFCYDMDGKLLWKKDLDSYPMAFGFGTGSSPVLADGRLFVQCDNEEKSFLVAFDAKSGQELWKAARPGKSSWSTPLLWKTKQRTELVACGSGKVVSYDPATGKVLWELGGIRASFQASPVADAERVYFGSGGPMGDGRLFAIKAGASGDITPKDGETSGDGIAWVQPRSAPYVASPLVYGEYLYVLQGTGNILTCYDARTGKQVYRERLTGARGFTSSPWAHDGKVFCLDDGGTTYVVQAGPAFKVLGKNGLDEMCWSSPAAGGGALFLRTVDSLYCIQQQRGEK
jgi:outer membrane protein assembly factor BamB